MGIFKLFKGEIKKIFLKPGIFVITTLLVFVLTLSAFIFSPQSRGNNLEEISGNTVGQMYDLSFGATSGQNLSRSKEKIWENNIASSQTMINFYNDQLADESLSKKQVLIDKIEESKELYKIYRNKCAQTLPDEEKEEARSNLKASLVNFRNLYNEYITAYNGFYYLLIDSDDKMELDFFLDSAITQPFQSTFTHTATQNKIEELDIFRKLTGFVNNMITFMPTKEDLELASESLTKSISNLNEIENEILNLKNNYSTDNSIENKLQYRTLYTKYKQCAQNANRLITLQIISSAIEDISDDRIQEIYQFTNEVDTKYSINEQLLICNYYLDTNKYAFEYASPLSLSETSNQDANMYDFMYFSLELCSFIIVIYIVFLGATMIAGEYSNGTMKLLAIRPYSRRKILASKLLATIFIGFIFLLLSVFVTAIIGGILFGTTSLEILLVFNASAITSTSPLVVILIYFLCKMIEIVFYAVFSISISTLFKSNTGSVIVSVLIYFASFILTLFTPSLGIVKFLPFVNTNLFGYFGSHNISSSASLLSIIFSKTIANDMNFYISFASITIFSVVLYFITSYVFRKRDIK